MSLEMDQSARADRGEMLQLIRAHAWEKTPMGPATGWPASLRTILDSLLVSGFPSVVLWGTELVQLYNDGYRDIMGTKHPAGLGQPTRECWPEVWHINAPIYERVRAGETVKFEDALYPIKRSGRLEDAWFTLSYSPLRDDAGTTAGVLVTVVETTARHLLQVENQALLERERLARAAAEQEREKLKAVFTQAPVGICMLEGPRHVFTFANPQYLALVNRSELLGTSLWEAFPEMRESGFDKIIDQVMATGVPYVGTEVPVLLPHQTAENCLIANFTYQPMRNAQGQVDGILAVVNDVTEQVRGRSRLEVADAALRKSEEAHRLVVEASGVGTCNVDLATEVVTYDARLQAIHGFPPGGQVSMADGFLTIDAEDRARIQAAVGLAVGGANGGNYLTEYRVHWPDGSVHWLEVRGRVFFGAAGEPVRLVASAALIDDRKSAERALRISEERLNAALAVSGAGIWDCNLLTGGATADRRFREIFGLSQDEVFSNELRLSLIHPGDRPRLEGLMDGAIANQNHGHYQTDYRIMPRHGVGVRWVAASVQCFTDEGGRPLRVVGTVLDITSRKETELAQERVLSSIANQSVFGMAVLHGPALRFTVANAAYTAMVGGREVIGHPLLDCVPELRDQGVDAEMHRVMRTGQAFSGFEKPYRIAGGSDPRSPVERFFSFIWYPLASTGGAIDSVLALSHEVTDLVRAREAQTRFAEEAKRRIEFEQMLLGIVSHDLRNPLTAIIFGAESLSRSSELDAWALRASIRIRSAAKRATRMVEDLLDFTQARLGGGIRIDPRPIDLNEVARNVVSEIEAAYPKRTLQVRCSGQARGTWDGHRLAQVIQNLVTNALKYGLQDAPVTVETHHGSDWVELRVHNLGAPITPEHLARLFEPMQRGTQGADPAQRSVGLGLYIVDRLVVAHGGTVSVESSAERGTTFVVRLPRTSPAVQ
jgi:sigma-B regulation protein RsbU (phosphoserine phosphatase)